MLKYTAGVPNQLAMCLLMMAAYCLNIFLIEHRQDKGYVTGATRRPTSCAHRGCRQVLWMIQILHFTATPGGRLCLWWHTLGTPGTYPAGCRSSNRRRTSNSGLGRECLEGSEAVVVCVEPSSGGGLEVNSQEGPGGISIWHIMRAGHRFINVIYFQLSVLRGDS